MKKQIMSKRGRRFDEGGEVQNMPRARTAEEDQESADKSAGLAASNKEKAMGFFERLRAGNIDDPTSEAYKRFGAGRGRAERIPVEDESFTAVKAPSEKAPVIYSRAEGINGTYAAMQTHKNADAEGEKITEGERIAQAMASKPDRVSSPQPSVSARPVSKPAAKKVVQQVTPEKEPKATVDNIPKSTPSGQIPGSSPENWTGGKGEKINSSELGRNVNNALNAVVPGPARGFSAAKNAAQGASKARALATTETPVTFLGKSGAKQVSGGPELSSAARKALQDNPTRKLTAPEAKKVAERTKELGYKKRATEEDWTGGAGIYGYKRGGSVASSRADGIAQRGKTRGKMC